MSNKLREIRGGWEILKETPVDNFKIFSTKKSLRRNPRSGSTFEFFLIDGHDWANVIALTPQEEVILVRQYRHGAEEFTLELPGGCIEPGEDPKLGVLRELREETGYVASDAECLGRMRPNPAMMSNWVSLYLAKNVQTKGEISLDEGEDIEVVLVPLSEVWGLVQSGKIPHALHVAAFGLLALRDKCR